MTSALETQIGGSHYKKVKIQPVEYIQANHLNFFEGNVVKYITRWRDKGGIEDLKKVLHYTQMLIEFEEKAIESNDCSGQCKQVDGEANHNVRAGLPTIHSRRIDDSQNVQPKWPEQSSRPYGKELEPFPSISDYVRQERRRNEQQGRFVPDAHIWLQSPMGPVSLRGSSLYFRDGEAGPA